MILDDKVANLEQEAARNTGLDVVAVSVPGLRSYNGEVYTIFIPSFIRVYKGAKSRHEAS